jgi:DNA replication and repair protein RecF
LALISVSTYNFRNLENCTVNTDSPDIFLVGENGQGKTNFLEAVYSLSFGNSFRTRYDSLLLKENEKELSVKGLYRDADSDENSVFLTLVNGKKAIQLNGKRIKDRKEIIHNNPCIVFSHDDIYFVNGPPDRRRIFFNQTISLFDLSFLDTLRRYEKILKNRNALLKENSSDLLEILDLQLAEEGLEIGKTRKKVIEEFNKTFSPVFKRVSGLDAGIRIIYRPSWNLDSSPENIAKLLASKRNAEFAAGATMSGPHRDGFFYYMDKKDFTKIASTGQTRLISLSLRSAQAEFYKLKTGRKPLVLLDDVLLELDKTRKIRFIDSFPEYEQAFYTFLPGEEELMRGTHRDGIFYTVKNGVIREQ